jgi:hypothetical protein
MLDSQSGLKDITLGKALGALPFVFQELTRNIPAFEIGWTTTRKTPIYHTHHQKKRPVCTGLFGLKLATAFAANLLGMFNTLSSVNHRQAVS